MSSLEARTASLGHNQLAATVERYAAGLAESVGVREAAELMVAAAFLTLYRADGAEQTRRFARRCYWCAVEALD
jgi:hypothetical protein